MFMQPSNRVNGLILSRDEIQISNSFFSAVTTPILPTEPQDHDQAIHRVHVNEVIMILRFYG